MFPSINFRGFSGISIFLSGDLPDLYSISFTYFYSDLCQGHLSRGKSGEYLSCVRIQRREYNKHFNLHIIQLEHKLNTSIQTPAGRVEKNGAPTRGQWPGAVYLGASLPRYRTVKICPRKTDPHQERSSHEGITFKKWSCMYLLSKRTKRSQFLEV